MKLRAAAREEPDVNMTPLIDVVFLMLIFFMVTTTFLREGSVEVSLPQASPAPAQAEAQPIELVINASGDYFLGGRPLANRQTQTLRRALEQAVQAGLSGLVIRADAATPHQAVVSALDAAGQLGIQKIGIATVPESE